MGKVVQLVAEIIKRCQSGERVVIHCNGGLGRAGTMAACVRIALGLDGGAAEAIAMVRKLRSPRAIETREQEDFVERFAGAWARR